MDWVFAAVAGVGFVEILIRLSLWQRVVSFRHTLDRILRVIRSPRISDHWKERVLPRYAGRMFTQSLLVAGCLLLALLPAVLLSLISDAMNVAFVSFASGWVGLLYMTVLATVYAMIRVRYGGK